MKTKQLMLEILLLNEKYTLEEIHSVKSLLKEDRGILDCLETINEPCESSKKMKVEQTNKKVNMKNLLAEVRKEDNSKYKLIKQIEAALQDTQMMKLQNIRDYARTLHIPFDRSTTRPKLIKEILIHLISLPTEQIIALEIDTQTKKVNQLEVLSQAILSQKKD